MLWRKMSWTKRHWALTLMLLVPLLAHGENFSEYDLKAAFVYNFAVFTDWPPQAPVDVVICVIGQDPFGPALDALAGKSVKGQSLAVRRLNTIAEARKCRVLFISESEAHDLSRLLTAVKDLPLLTVADMPDAAQQGVMIGLVTEDRRVTFEVNVASARKAGIAISSRLLTLARIVYPSP
jgi:hypothetical protein